MSQSSTVSSAGVGTAALGAGLDLGASFLSGYLQERANESAARANANALATLNNNNYQFFRESRGEGGFSHLPYYAQDARGNPYEPKLFEDSLALFESIINNPSGDLYREELAGYQESARDGARALGDLFSGESLRREESNLREVDRQRKLGVDASRNAKIKALNEQLDQMEAEQRLSGFRGSRSGTRKLNFTAQRNANSQAASDLATTNLQHNLELQAARNNDFNQRLRYINEPANQARRLAAASDLEAASAIGRFNQAISVFDQFRLPSQYFQAQGLPQVVPDFSLLSTFEKGDEVAAAINEYLVTKDYDKWADFWSSTGQYIKDSPAYGSASPGHALGRLTTSGSSSINDSSYSPNP